jgi:hypothetical protein
VSDRGDLLVTRQPRVERLLEVTSVVHQYLPNLVEEPPGRPLRSVPPSSRSSRPATGTAAAEAHLQQMRQQVDVAQLAVLPAEEPRVGPAAAFSGGPYPRFYNRSVDSAIDDDQGQAAALPRILMAGLGRRRAISVTAPFTGGSSSPE